MRGRRETLDSMEGKSKDSKSAVTEKDIRTRAYEIYIERGGSDGRALSDWLQAEGELKKSAAKAASRAKKEKKNLHPRNEV
jgi:Protein of unknown function (DUF2934)